ncbi:MAG: hypothetical protein ACRBF0_24490 [Calditrichia bacterium]
MNELFTLSISSTKLPRISYFGSLEKEVKDKFESNRISIRSDSPILKTKNKNEWRIISEEKEKIRAFRIRLSFSKNTDEEILTVFPDTVSGLPSSLWDFNVFTSDVHLSRTKRKLYYSASIRPKLLEKQKQKWDFFFRPDIEKLNNNFDEIIDRCEMELEQATDLLSSSTKYLLFSGILVVSAVISFQFQYWLMFFLLLAIILLIFTPYTFFKVIKNTISLNIEELKNEVNKLELYLDHFRKEKEIVLEQLNDIKLPSIDEILRWREEEIAQMREISKEIYFLDADESPKTDTLNGFAIYQPEFKEMSELFPKNLSSFFGFKKVANSLFHSGMFLVFIFQNDSKICISKFFYNFILSKKFREENLEYHYSDLVGIAINSILINNPFKDEEVENKEIDTIWISFTDSKSVELAIMDKDTSNDIVDRLANPIENNEIDDSFGFLDEEMNLSEEKIKLDMNKAVKIVRYIKDKKASQGK